MSLIRISVLHNEDRLAGTKTNLERGSGNPKIKVYSGTRPSNDVPVGGNVLLCTITLSRPVGTITPGSGQLALTLPADALILADGTASWAIVENGNGDYSAGLEVTDNGGSGDLKMQTTALFAGGATRLLSAVIQ
jgi:hypothetical protein